MSTALAFCHNLETNVLLIDISSTIVVTFAPTKEAGGCRKFSQNVLKDQFYLVRNSFFQQILKVYPLRKIKGAEAFLEQSVGRVGIGSLSYFIAIGYQLTEE